MVHRIKLIARLMRSRLRLVSIGLVSIGLLCMALPLCRAVSALPTLNASPSFPLIQVAAMTLPDPIFRRWTHSHEEDVGDTLVYRPSGFPFPPARGRDGLEFRTDGAFIRYQIGPTDRSQAVTGQWIAEDADVVRVQFPNQSSAASTLTIVECSEQILKIEQTEGSI